MALIGIIAAIHVLLRVLAGLASNVAVVSGLLLGKTLPPGCPTPITQ